MAESIPIKKLSGMPPWPVLSTHQPGEYRYVENSRRAMLASFVAAPKGRYRVGDLELDWLSDRVTRADQEIVLRSREFRLLEYLMRHAGQAVTRTMLRENVWDYHCDPQINVIEVYISRLRSKIEKGFSKPLLHSLRGIGFTTARNARAGIHAVRVTRPVRRKHRPATLFALRNREP
jgi:DNA-binding winged helix-turn-helix (wHTH) protein